jgi:hypothetical protein
LWIRKSSWKEVGTWENGKKSKEISPFLEWHKIVGIHNEAMLKTFYTPYAVHRKLKIKVLTIEKYLIKR